MKFPVFRLGAPPVATAKQQAGIVDVPVTCGGARVRPGDIIVGDDWFAPREISKRRNG